MSMNEPATISTPLTMPEKLALARQAFRDFHTQCFWFMREDGRSAKKISKRLSGVCVLTGTVKLFSLPHNYAANGISIRSIAAAGQPAFAGKFFGGRHGVECRAGFTALLQGHGHLSRRGDERHHQRGNRRGGVKAGRIHR